MESRPHVISQIQTNICTDEGVVGDRCGWIICEMVGAICSFIKPFQEDAGS